MAGLNKGKESLTHPIVRLRSCLAFKFIEIIIFSHSAVWPPPRDQILRQETLRYCSVLSVQYLPTVFTVLEQIIQTLVTIYYSIVLSYGQCSKISHLKWQSHMFDMGWKWNGKSSVYKTIYAWLLRFGDTGRKMSIMPRHMGNRLLAAFLVSYGMTSSHTILSLTQLWKAIGSTHENMPHGQRSLLGNPRKA